MNFIFLRKRVPNCHPEPFACHSERSEESALPALEGKLREGSALTVEKQILRHKAPQNDKIRNILFVLSFFIAGSAFAAQYDIKEMTPKIQQALQNRQERYESLQDMKGQGMLGENNRGYVETLKGAASDASSIADSENEDRRVIYNAIVEQNELPPSGLAQVETVFADVQRDKARSGDFIQTPSGEWTKK